MEHLRQWSGDQPLLVASFYFWAAGSKTQTSEEGLFRTLLYQIVNQAPGVLQYASPKRWEALCLFDDDPKAFTEDELRLTLHRAIQHLSNVAMKLCLFIDGLDEFDGNHGDLIELVKKLISTPSVKVCVASRPWIVFEDAMNNKPSLRLEELTYNDIKKYVTARLSVDSNFSLLIKREFEFANKLLDRIVGKAGGVFLWVNLVVSSLLDGMKYGDRVSDLQRRLDSLPPDLEDLYDRILNNLEPFYFEHATQYFRLMAACHRPPPALTFLFADEESPAFALGSFKTNPVYSDSELQVETMRRRLNSRCKGLIEIGRQAPRDSSFHTPTVQYLHKTVKDYIEKPEIQRKLFADLKSPFDPHLRLCAAWLVWCKGMCMNESMPIGRKREYLVDPILLCMKHASRIAAENTPHVLQFLDELDRVTSHILQDIFKHHPRVPFCLEEEKTHSMIEAFESTGKSFLSLAVKCGVVEYVKANAQPGGFVQESTMKSGQQSHLVNQPLLWPRSMIRFISWKSGLSARFLPEEKRRQLLQDATPSALPNASMVLVLLQKGADPNYPGPKEIHGNLSGKTVWITTLAVVMVVFSGQSWDPDGKTTWLEIVRHMMAHGARIDKKTITLAFDLLSEHFTTTGLSKADAVDMLLRGFQSCKKNRAVLQLEFLSALHIRLRPRIVAPTYLGLVR
jgi:hypothetical protein